VAPFPLEPLTMTDSLEGEIETRGNRVRIRLRLCRGIWVAAAFRETLDRTAPIASALLRMREFLPKEFRDHPEVQREIYDPLEEIWQDRLRLL
jgi:hypothetical protein